jgi:hypothetical protein
MAERSRGSGLSEAVVEAVEVDDKLPKETRVRRRAGGVVMGKFS